MGSLPPEVEKIIREKEELRRIVRRYFSVSTVYKCDYKTLVNVLYDVLSDLKNLGRCDHYNYKVFEIGNYKILYVWVECWGNDRLFIIDEETGKCWEIFSPVPMFD